MRILLIHNKYQSINIGGEDIVYENELVAMRSILGDGNVFSYEVSNDEIYKFQLLFSIWFSYKHYRKIKALVLENHIDIVHVHNFYPLLTPSIFKAAKKGGAVVIHTLHNYRLWCISGILYRDDIGICEQCVNKRFPLSGMIHKCFRKSRLQSILAQLSFQYYKMTKAFSQVDYFFVLTQFQKNKVKSLGIDHGKIILKPNGVDGFVKKSQIKGGYIYVGRLEASKGILLLLDVWKGLGLEYTLIIIGTGELESSLKEKYNQKNIIFKGKCSREETLKSISKSKYLIQTSLCYETFGLTIIEAMSLGIPVLGFNIGTRKDLIKDGVNGFLCEGNELRNMIMKSYNHQDYSELSENALLTAKQFQNSLVTLNQINIYNNILEKK
jgi:glycosyltransferase involved in cell wall biosynthesis